MSKRLNLIIAILATVVMLGLIGLGFRYALNNPVSEANGLKKKARKEYYAREFLSAYKSYEQLVDSMQIKDDAASINYGNAAFMSSGILKDGLYGRNPSDQPLSDTILNMLAAKSRDTYVGLTVAKNKKISSMAYNQLGYSVVKSGEAAKEPSNPDSLFLEAIGYFRQALKENPNNDSARYNYELLKKIIGFPETIMAKTKALVAQKRYIEAATLLERSMERDIRLARQKEYLNRIKSVAGIDTTYRGKI